MNKLSIIARGAILMFAMTAACFGILGLLGGCASQPKHVIVKQNPPQFFSGIVTYRNNHIQRLFVSSDRFLTCTDALRDTNSALAKLLGEAPDGAAAKGLCIPVPTLDVSDLVPRELF